VLPPAEAARLTDDVRWLGRKLGAVRDLDVHLKHLDEYAEALDTGERHCLAAYRKHLQQSRREAHQALMEALASVRLTTLLEDYADLLLRTPNHDGDLAELRSDQAAARIAAPSLDDLLRRGRKIDESAKARKLHKLRIRVKRVRYLLEYLSTPYAPALDRVAKRLAKLQDVLGDHQDAYVARDHLAEYVDAHRLGKAERRTFKHLRKIEKRRAKAARARFDKAWRKLESAAAPALHVLH
jgi:CHAD domain-containing protein